MKLVIAEKPSVAQSISKVLKATSRKDGYTEGNGYIVTWCVGHLVSLAPPESYGERYNKWEALPIIPQKWKYDIIPGTKKQFGIIKKLMSDKRIDTIVCATDAGREGELIFRLVYEKCKCKKPVKRLWVSSLEDEAIRKGFENLKSSKCYDDLYRSALCRERADWLIGMNATRYFTVKNGNKGVISIGRVQTPTLALIVSRDREIQNFVKKKYYTVEINCGEFTAESKRIDDLETAKVLFDNCRKAKAVIKSITKEDKSISPPKLYDLTALQRDANRIYGFTSQQTLDIVQKLYEDKLVTYPRTDSRYLTEDMLQPASEIINIVVDKLHLNTYTPNIETVMDNSKVSNHHAIIPTANISDIEIDTLEDKSQMILLLLMKRLVSATSDKYRYKNTVVLLECCGADFKAAGRTATDKGFKAIENTPDEDNNESYIPNISENSEYSVVSNLCEHYTQPPKPYTEDICCQCGVWKALRKKGAG